MFASSTPANVFGYLGQISSLYDQFLGYFPEQFRVAVSLALALLLVYAVYQVIKKNFIFIILLVLLLPPSVPILKNIWDNVFAALQFLIKR
jgi:hypothetical protein